MCTAQALQASAFAYIILWRYLLPLSNCLLECQLVYVKNTVQKSGQQFIYVFCTMCEPELGNVYRPGRPGYAKGLVSKGISRVRGLVPQFRYDLTSSYMTRITSILASLTHL